MWRRVAGDSMAECSLCDQRCISSQWVRKCCFSAKEVEPFHSMCHDCAESTSSFEISYCKMCRKRKNWKEHAPPEDYRRSTVKAKHYRCCKCDDINHVVFCTNCGKCDKTILIKTECCSRDICWKCSVSRNEIDIKICRFCKATKKWIEIRVGSNAEVPNPIRFVKAQLSEGENSNFLIS